MRKRMLLVIAVAAVALPAARWALAQPPADPLDPVRVAGDTHRLAFENAFVRVLDVHLPPGKVEPRHRHPHGMSTSKPASQLSCPTMSRVGSPCTQPL